MAVVGVGWWWLVEQQTVCRLMAAPLLLNSINGVRRLLCLLPQLTKGLKDINSKVK